MQAQDVELYLADLGQEGNEINLSLTNDGLDLSRDLSR